MVFSAKDLGKIWRFLRYEKNHLLLKVQNHKNIWLKCSGAQNRIVMNPGYYEALKNTTLRYPHPGSIDIEKDLLRSG